MGAIAKTEMSNRTVNGCRMRLDSIGWRPSAAATSSTTVAASAKHSVLFVSPIRGVRNAPIPVKVSSEKRTTESEYVGKPRKRTNRWMRYDLD